MCKLYIRQKGNKPRHQSYRREREVSHYINFTCSCFIYLNEIIIEINDDTL